MGPHVEQRTGQGSAMNGGRKRKAPGDGARDHPQQQAGQSNRHPKETDRPQHHQMKVGDGKALVRKGQSQRGEKGKEENTNARVVDGSKGKGKGKSAIDDIFSGVKRLKEEKAEEEVERVENKKRIKEEHKRRQANPFTGEGRTDKRWAWADEVKPVRFDDEGLPIYTWDSLRIGKGGGTELCPFDCDCCF